MVKSKKRGSKKVVKKARNNYKTKIIAKLDNKLNSKIQLDMSDLSKDDILSKNDVLLGQLAEQSIQKSAINKSVQVSINHQGSINSQGSIHPIHKKVYIIFAIGLLLMILVMFFLNINIGDRDIVGKATIITKNLVQVKDKLVDENGLCEPGFVKEKNANGQFNKYSNSYSPNGEDLKIYDKNKCISICAAISNVDNFVAILNKDGKDLLCINKNHYICGSSTYGEGSVINTDKFEVLCLLKNGVYNWVESNSDNDPNSENVVAGLSADAITTKYSDANYLSGGSTSDNGVIIFQKGCNYIAAKFDDDNQKNNERWIGCNCGKGPNGVKANTGEQFAGYECKSAGANYPTGWSKLLTKYQIKADIKDQNNLNIIYTNFPDTNNIKYVSSIKIDTQKPSEVIKSHDDISVEEKTPFKIELVKLGLMSAGVFCDNCEVIITAVSGTGEASNDLQFTLNKDCLSYDTDNPDPKCVSKINNNCNSDNECIDGYYCKQINPSISGSCELGSDDLPATNQQDIICSSNSDCASGKSCIRNSCVTDNPDEPVRIIDQSVLCTDSDHGNDDSRKGFITYDGKTTNSENRPLVDSCTPDNKKIIEYFCVKDSQGKWNYNTESHYCPNGCKDGACVIKSTNPASDTILCKDTDPSGDIYLIGTVTIGAEAKEDSCTGSKLTQYLCKIENDKVIFATEDYTCKAGCEHTDNPKKCLDETTSSLCKEGTLPFNACGKISTGDKDTLYTFSFSTIKENDGSCKINKKAIVCKAGCNVQTAQCNSELTCTDGIKNGEEGDIDCGLECAAKCANEKTCIRNADCTSSYCDKTVSICKDKNVDPIIDPPIIKAEYKEIACIDPIDNAKNPYQEGITYKYGASYSDICKIADDQKSYLQEYSCNINSMVKSVYECSKGCQTNLNACVQ